MRRIIWTAEARSNVEAIRAYIRDFNPAAAERMAARLISAAEALREFPERGRHLRGGVRELAIISPYLIRYRVLDDFVAILQVRHGARRPD